MSEENTIDQKAFNKGKLENPSLNPKHKSKFQGDIDIPAEPIETINTTQKLSIGQIQKENLEN